MGTVRNDRDSVKSKFRLLPSGMNLPTHEHLERALHDDEQTGLYCWGDVSIWPASEWPQACDNWFWTTNPEDDQRDETEKEIVEHNLKEETESIEFETEEEAEYLAWLDSLAPCDEELTAMERHFEIHSWGFGHDA